MRRLVAVLAGAASVLLAAAPGFAQSCLIDQPTVDNVLAQLRTVVQEPDANGGLFKPNKMWAAVVDRKGTLCGVTSSGDVWPGSRAIAIAKASTANDFSNGALALSTANLYAPTQPGGSLYGLNNSNPFDPKFLNPSIVSGGTPGGIITFGGGVALYRHKGGAVIGGLGVSGDTSCADHAISYRMRHLARLDNTPNSDNIIYGPTTASGFWQPHCGTSDITP